MTRRQAEVLLRETEGRLCTRFYRRPDGTILTENCPVGLKAIGRRISRVAGAAISAFATISSVTAAQLPFFPIPVELREANSAVSGVVKDEGGMEIGNANVVISRQGSGTPVVVKADATGRFSVESLPWDLTRFELNHPDSARSTNKWFFCRFKSALLAQF